jgi:hypothetical protein
MRIAKCRSRNFANGTNGQELLGEKGRDPSRARACEYVADFERIGRQALRRPEWKGRLKLFEAYFLQGADYRRAIGMVGVAEGTFDYWYQEVKRALGSEFSRTGLFPPTRYFKHS